MSDRKSKQKKAEDPGAPAWMTTYGDMVTLLLAFFILLFTFSVIDVTKFHKIMNSIQLSFLGYTGVLEKTQELSDREDVDTSELEESVQVTPEEMEILQKIREADDVQQQVQEFLRDVGLEDDVELKVVEDRGVVMELPDQIFFEIGRSELKPEARYVLDKLADLFRGLDNNIIIEGHTCDLPIRTPQFPSNWELSVGRSVAVTRYMVEQQGITPHRFIATGYGEFQPLVPNDTPEDRARNRRVTVVVSIF